MKNWDDLKYVLAVYRNGGLSAAARELGVNHATVSRRITALEEKLNLLIFDRFPEGMRPTKYGLELVSSAEIIEKHILEIDLSITAKDMNLAGPLKISAPQLIIQYYLAEVFMEFNKLYPQIELSIIASSDALNLARREADISIRASKEPEGSLWGRKILAQNCGFYGNLNLLKRITPQSVLPCINFLWWGDEPASEVLDAYPFAKVVAKFDDMVAVYGAVSSGMGIARLPCFLGDRDANLKRVAHLDLQPYSDIWVLTHPDLKRVTRITTFMRFVADGLKRQESWFLGTKF